MMSDKFVYFLSLAFAFLMRKIIDKRLAEDSKL